MAILEKAVKAKCTKCGYAGGRSRTKNPDLYRCGGCYYSMHAAGSRYRANELRDRADKLDAEALMFDESARQFMERNPGSGPPIVVDMRGVEPWPPLWHANGMPCEYGPDCLRAPHYESVKDAMKGIQAAVSRPDCPQEE